MNRHASACARTIPHRQPTAKPPCLLARPRSSRPRSAFRLSHLRNSQVAVQARYSRQATATALVAVTGSSRGPAARAAASSIHAPCVNPGLPAVPSPNPSRPGIMAPDPPAPSRGRNRPAPPDLSRAARGKRARPADTSDARLPDVRSCQAPAARCRIPSLHLSGPPLRAAPPARSRRMASAILLPLPRPSRPALRPDLPVTPILRKRPAPASERPGTPAAVDLRPREGHPEPSLERQLEFSEQTAALARLGLSFATLGARRDFLAAPGHRANPHHGGGHDEGRPARKRLAGGLADPVT